MRTSNPLADLGVPVFECDEPGCERRIAVEGLPRPALESRGWWYAKDPLRFSPMVLCPEHHPAKGGR